MLQIMALDVEQLEPGMVLAEPLCNNITGLALYTAGTVINERVLKRIDMMSIQGKVLVYDPDSLVETLVQEDVPSREEKILEPDDVTITHSKKQEQESINLSLQTISQHSLKIYNSVFKTVKNFYQSASLSGNIDVKEAKIAASEISDEIIRDPQVMLQIAVLKDIDNYTYSHAIHVAIYITMLARVMGFSEGELRQVCLAGLLHDIGKVDIPLEILNKTDRLNQAEYTVIQEHVLYSFKRVHNLHGVDRNILAAIGQHHEKMDGSGYMQKLKGQEIHKWGRMLAIADVYDAVTSRRVYKEAILPHEGAEILMGSIGHLDYDLLKLFLKHISIYPVGCKVMLNTGEAGTVFAANPDLPTRPFVQLDTISSDSMDMLDLSNSLTTFITGIIK